MRGTPAYHRAVILPALLTKRQYVVNHQHDFLVVDRNDFSDELLEKYRPNHRSSMNDKIATLLSESQFILTTQFVNIYLPYAQKLNWLKDQKGRVFIQLRLNSKIELGNFSYEKQDIDYLDSRCLSRGDFNQASNVNKAHALTLTHPTF